MISGRKLFCNLSEKLEPFIGPRRVNNHYSLLTTWENVHQLHAKAVKWFSSKNQSTNTAQWIITGLERNIVSNMSKYYDLLEPNS